MSLVLTADSTAPYPSGSTVVVTYSGLVLNPPVPPTTVTVSGSASVDGGPAQPATVSVSIGGKPADTVVYATPSAPGLTFTVSPTNPAVFSAKVP